MLVPIVAALLQSAAPAPTAIPIVQPAGEDIEVVGRRERRQIRTVVRRLLDHNGWSQIARYEKKVCPGIVGMREDAANRLLVQMRADMAAVGARLDDPGCDVSALVVFTDQPQQFTNQMLDRMYLARYMPIDRLRALRQNTGAIRSWRVQTPVGADGSTPALIDAMYPISLGLTGSRILMRTLSATALSVAVIDTRAAAGKSLQQLSGIATLHLLIPIHPDASAKGADTIANLFDAASPPDRMTAIDRGMLRGLYLPQFNNRQTAAQAGRMARQVRQLRAADATALGTGVTLP